MTTPPTEEEMDEMEGCFDLVEVKIFEHRLIEEVRRLREALEHKTEHCRQLEHHIEMTEMMKGPKK